MIALKYAQLILNALFHTTGGAGITAEQEKEKMINAEAKDDRVPSYVFASGVTGKMYADAFQANGNKTGGEQEKIYNDYKPIIEKSEWYHVKELNNPDDEEYDEYIYKYETTISGQKVETSKTFYGWKAAKNDEQMSYYPKEAYLALFTTMPDANGLNYKEPTTEEVGAETTYMRVNLHEGIISGTTVLNTAFGNDETGAATINNKELIAFPEVFGVDWGKVVGFGVFDTEEAMTGVPVFWGKITQEKQVTTNHVPLFRSGEFQVTIQ